MVLCRCLGRVQGVEGHHVSRLATFDPLAAEPVLFVVRAAHIGIYRSIHTIQQNSTQYNENLLMVAPDSSVAHVVNRLLPLGALYAAVRHHVDVHVRYECGLVHHALAAAIGHILQVFLLSARP